MTGRHHGSRGAHVVYLTALSLVGISVAMGVHLLVRTSQARADERRAESPGTTAPAAQPSSATAPAAVPAVPPSTVPPPAPAAPSATASAAAASRIAASVAGLPAGSVSVAAYDTATGAAFRYGAASGMTAASVVKLQILETLLLDDGAKHATLSDQQDADATAMMDNSDNDAADAVFDDVGDTAGLVAAQSALGLSAATVPGPDDQWGLTTTSAGEQLALLNDLVAANSPLDANERGYALNLMQNVESDQRWGAPAAADPGTAFAVKDGWLALDGDNDLWAVNSDAVVTVHGQQVLISVLTQHDASEQDGITLAQSLAAAAAAAVSGAG